MQHTDLGRWQIAPVEDHQPGNATDQTGDYQHCGIPAGDGVLSKRLYALSVVERLNFQHPGQFIGESAERVHQVGKANNTERCTASRAAGIEE